MSESPYAIPVEDLVASARIPRTEQVEIQGEAPRPEPDRSGGFLRYADGAGGDADGE